MATGYILRILKFAPVLALAASSIGEASASQEIRYGQALLQTADFEAPNADRPVPLVIFVHGGGWKRGDKSNATGRYMAPHFTDLGYAFVSINYRLVPEARVEQQAQDVADAIAAFIGQANALHIDKQRIVLMGHSAGAHLVALVGTDPRYLRRAKQDMNALAGVVPIDGAAYDVPRQMNQAGPMMGKTYAQAFGNEPGRQRALSPVFQAASPNAPAFLILHVGRIDGTQQAQELEAALRKAATPVERHAFAGKGLSGHIEINRRLGDPAYPATKVLDAWLKKILR